VDLIRARYFTHAQLGRQVSLLVLHSMEHPEKPGTARAVAQWFASPDSPEASAHYCVDDREVVRCVEEQDVAWAAPGANQNGIHIEHAGYANQSERDWLDEYSLSMLRVSARLAADICVRHKIPARALAPVDLKNGLAGITTHAAISVAFRKSDHWDPGPSFPMSTYLGLVIAAINE